MANANHKVVITNFSEHKQITRRTRLGFIGLGFLGSRIARRLVAAGFPMVIYDLDRAKSAKFGAEAEIAESPATLARNVDVVLSCLPDEHAVEAVYVGPGNVLQSVKPGALIIDLSTISPETSRQLRRAAGHTGSPALDVAVSGSTPSAEAGTLTLFGGGEKRIFEACDPIFSAIAKQWFYIGPSGSGMAMKLVVNTLLGVGMQALAEAVALGSKLNLPRDLVLDTLAKTAVVSPAHAGKLITAKQHDYSPQFPIRLMRKDFGLVLTEAAQARLEMPATEAASVVNSEESAAGIEEDFSAVFRQMEQRAGTKEVIH